MIFQEKHTSGWLWTKKTYYTYFVYRNEAIEQLEVRSLAYINSVEQK